MNSLYQDSNNSLSAIDVKFSAWWCDQTFYASNNRMADFSVPTVPTGMYYVVVIPCLPGIYAKYTRDARGFITHSRVFLHRSHPEKCAPYIHFSCTNTNGFIQGNVLNTPQAVPLICKASVVQVVVTPCLPVVYHEYTKQ